MTPTRFSGRRLALGGLLAVAALLAAQPLAGGPAGAAHAASYLALELGAAGCCLWAARLPGERAAWLAVAAGLACFAAGDAYFMAASPGSAGISAPSPADAGYVAFYPCCWAGVVLLLRRGREALPAGALLDGVVAGLAAGALAGAAVFGPVVTGTGGDPLSVAVNLAYPIGDLLLLALTAGLIGVVGGRGGRRRLLLAAGFALFAVTDVGYLYASASGTYVESSALNLGWPLAMVLIGAAALLRPAPERPRRRSEHGSLAVPTLAGIACLGILVVDHYERLEEPAIWLATLGLLAVMARLALTFGEHSRLLARTRHEAGTDALTGLANRRELLRDLEQVFGAPRPAGLLALFDLDGFKAFNDRFGHVAGDDLLQRLGAGLDGAVGADGRVYRMGGDEFCVLFGCADAAATGLARASAALTLEEAGVVIRASSGSVRLGEEAHGAIQALQLADERMYEEKRERSRRPVGVATVARGAAAAGGPPPAADPLRAARAATTS